MSRLLLDFDYRARCQTLRPDSIDRAQDEVALHLLRKTLKVIPDASLKFQKKIWCMASLVTVCVFSFHLARSVVRARSGPRRLRALTPERRPER